MFDHTTVILIAIQVLNVLSVFLDAEPNPQKPILERTNIVNKGVWIRNQFNDNQFEKAKQGDFIFRENSMDVDNILQNNFDAFGENYMQSSPFVSAYVERQKRSSYSSRQRRPRKSISNKISKSNDYANLAVARSKLLNDLRPSSLFNDYPYEVAVLLSSNKNHPEQANKTVDDNYNKTNSDFIELNKEYNNSTNTTIVSIDKKIENTNEAFKNVSSTKRSMKYDLESELIKKIEFTEVLPNKTEEYRAITGSAAKINDRNVFDKDNSEWHPNVPIPDINVYKVVPKEPVQKSKAVTERGLIKVIAMLTKTFKKIMKQHLEIKDIHSKIGDISDEFSKTATTINTKFQDFDLKYHYLVKLQDKLKDYETKLASQEDYFKMKDKELARNFKEFENQQKKFLQQQKQFYNIQKLMLSQNEKINIKQNLIAKTQSEIAQRQNNFARILKKAKQLYVDSRNPTMTKLSSSIAKMKDTSKVYDSSVTHTSTQAPEPTTDSIKINLFSIPTSNKIQEDPDEMILKEKDDQAIDDLVYKYYFNNTFIDNFMKSKILNSFMGNTENASNVRNVKNKRDKLETTILLPVMEMNESVKAIHNRERRWINHHSRNKHKRRDRGKAMLAQIVNVTDEKRRKQNERLSIDYAQVPVVIPSRDPVKNNPMKDDPFLTMAKSFCSEIGQNLNHQMLSWCIEKALRRLQFLEGKLPPSPKAMPAARIPHFHADNYQTIQEAPTKIVVIPLGPENIDKIEINTAKPTQETAPSSTIVGVSEMTGKPITVASELSTTTVITTNAKYTNTPPNINTSSPPDLLHFPDNDELELNLKQYELKPDLEGNVYYEGSVHASELIGDSDSGVDDIMPGLDSNSRVDMDPLTFDVQAKRRALVRKLNERIKMAIG